MHTRKLFGLFFSGYVEIFLLIVGSILHIIYTYGSICWLVLAIFHFCFSYKRIRQYNINWYKEWNAFIGLADLCFSAFIFILAKTFSLSTNGDIRITMFAIFIIICWFTLFMWSGFVARRYSDQSLAIRADIESER